MHVDYNLGDQLTHHDNKALALSYAGFVAGVGLVLYGVLSGEKGEYGFGKYDFALDLLITFGWGFMGVVLLLFSRIINEHFLLSKFDNVKEVITDHNIGTGAVECGTYIGTGLIIQAAITGDGYSPTQALISSLIFFILGQGVFIGFGFLYSKIVRFDIHDQIEVDNPAAGLGFGMNLIAAAVILSAYMRYADSIIGFLAWAVMASFLLITCRYIVDRILLPGNDLDSEISEDRNWGAAIIEGSAAISVAMIVSAAYFA